MPMGGSSPPSPAPLLHTVAETSKYDNAFKIKNRPLFELEPLVFELLIHPDAVCGKQ